MNNNPSRFDKPILTEWRALKTQRLVRSPRGQILNTAMAVCGAALFLVATPGCHYARSTLGTGAPPGQSLGLASVTNLRDLGGYKTRDGHFVRKNLLYRSNRLAKISPEDGKRIAALGLKSDYDLRTD